MLNPPPPPPPPRWGGGRCWAVAAGDVVVRVNSERGNREIVVEGQRVSLLLTFVGFEECCLFFPEAFIACNCAPWGSSRRRLPGYRSSRKETGLIPRARTGGSTQAWRGRASRRAHPPECDLLSMYGGNSVALSRDQCLRPFNLWGPVGALPAILPAIFVIKNAEKSAPATAVTGEGRSCTWA